MMSFVLLRWKTGENTGKYHVSEIRLVHGLDEKLPETFKKPLAATWWDTKTSSCRENDADIIAVNRSRQTLEKLKNDMESKEKTSEHVDDQQSILKDASDLQEKLSSFERKYRDQRSDNNRFIIELKEKMDGMREIIQRMEAPQPTENIVILDEEIVQYVLVHL